MDITNKKLQQLGNEGWHISFSTNDLTKNFNMWLCLEPEVAEAIDMGTLLTLEGAVREKLKEVASFFNSEVTKLINPE